MCLLVVSQLQILSCCFCSVLQSFEPCLGYSVLELAAVKNHHYFLHWTSCSSAVSDINHWQTGQDLRKRPRACYLCNFELSEKQFRNNIVTSIDEAYGYHTEKAGLNFQQLFGSESFLCMAKLFEKQLHFAIL